MNHFFASCSSWLLLLLSQSSLLLAVSADTSTTCSLCETAFAAPYDPFALIVFQDEVLTCLELFQKNSMELSSAADCDTLHLIGATACDCRQGIPTTVNDCTLCEDGSPLPAPQQPALTPGNTCASMEEDAKRDNIAACPRYQGVIGVYCHCDNPQTSKQVCALCGTGNRLPDPTRVVSGISCIEREFYTSLGGNCAAEKELYAAECCYSGSFYAPPISTIGGSCFSERGMVRILKRNNNDDDSVRRNDWHKSMIASNDDDDQETQLISISNLLIGDYVQDSDDDSTSFSRVYTFGHYDSTLAAEYLQIYTTTNDKKKAPPLELSPLHMVLRNEKFVAASTLSVGDKLTKNGLVISDIRQVTRTGAYAPFTESGTIVVNGIVASSFVAKAATTTSNVVVVLPYHWLAYFSQAPHRLYSRLLLDTKQQQRYYAPLQEGISPWIPTTMVTWWTTTTDNHEWWLLPMMIQLPPLVLLCSVATVVEHIMVLRRSGSPLLLLVVIVVAVMMYATRRRRQQKIV